MLRKLLDRFKGAMPEQVWIALDAAVEEVEGIKGLVNCLEDYPTGRIKPDSPERALLFQSLGSRMAELAVGDLERIYEWTQTRPLWQFGKPPEFPLVRR